MCFATSPAVERRIRARRLTVVLNPRSGAGADGETQEKIESLFSDHGLRADVVLVTGQRDWVSEVRARARASAAVIAGGGDGTVNLVASAVAGTPQPMGVLPLGTLNHFARDLRLDGTLEQAIATIAGGHTIRVDLGEVNDRVFVNNCSMGVYPMIVHVRDELRRQGYAKWIAFLIAAKAVLERHPELRVRLATDTDDSLCHTPFVLVGNNAYDVAGLRVTGRSSLQEGRLFAYLAPDAPTSTLPRRMLREVIARILARSRTLGPAFHVISGEEILIDTDGPRRVRIALDGEVAVTSLPLRCRVRPQALQVFVPPVPAEARLSAAS
jgi:diacylglycerol kinase family enzyme